MGRFSLARASARYWFGPADQLSQVNLNIRNLVIDTAWQGLMMGGIFTFLSVFLVRLGASSFQVGLLTSVPSAILVVLAIPAAQLVQRQRNLVRFTNRMRVLHRGSLLLVAVLPFFVRDRLIETILVVWGLKTVAIAFIEPSWVGVVAEVIPPKRRAAVNGGRWALVSAVMAVAGVAYGYLMDSVQFPLGYQIVFAVSFLGGAAGMFFWAKIALPEGAWTPPSAAGRTSVGTRLRRYVGTFGGEPQFVKYLLTASVLRFGLHLPAALYSIYWIRHLGASDLWIGWQATAGKLALIVGYFVWGIVATRRGHFLALFACTIGLGLYPALTAVVPAQSWLPLVALVQGFFVTGIDLAFFNTLLHVCPADRRPSFVAVNSVFVYLAMSLAPIAGSALADCLDIRTVLLLSGAIHLLAAVLFWLFRVADDHGS